MHIFLFLKIFFHQRWMMLIIDSRFIFTYLKYSCCNWRKIRKLRLICFRLFFFPSAAKIIHSPHKLITTIFEVPLISPVFLKRSLVFPNLYCFPLCLCIVHWRRAFLPLFAIVWNSAFSSLCKKIGDMKGTTHARMGTIKDRNDKDITKAENIKKRWQE